MTVPTKFSTFLLLLAIVVGAFFRFYELGKTPAGFYLDEAAMGYNAYSVLQTGKDEFGMPFPTIFRSFLDFKTPVYTYLVVPLIPTMGLTPFSVRFPSAFLGVLTLPLLYLLLKKLISNPVIARSDSDAAIYKNLPSISTLFLALSPWHIIFSRTAYETNIALFFLLLGTLLFTQAIKRPWFFVVSAISFAVSFLAYHAERIVVPALVLSLIVYFFKPLVSNFKKIVFPVSVGAIIGLFLILPTLKLMKTPGFLSRATTLNIFSYQNQMPWGYKNSSSSILKLLNTTQALSLKEFASLYTSYFSPRYLFSIGDSGPRSSYPDFGTFFVWQFPLYLAGLYFLVKEKELRLLKIVTFVLLFVSPLPAALTRDPYTTIRSLPMVIPLVIIMGLGLNRLLQINWLAVNRFKFLIVGFLILVSSVKLFISIVYFNDYFRAQHWDYGWDQVVSVLKNLNPTLPIVVDNTRGEAYIHLLFFLQYNPKKFQSDNFEVSSTEYYTNMTRNKNKKLGNITVKNFQWGIDTDKIEKYLIVDATSISKTQYNDHQMTLIAEILYPNKDVAFRILKTNPTQK